MTTIEHLIKAGERMHAAIDALGAPLADAGLNAMAAQRDWEHYLLRYQTENAARITPPETIDALKGQKQ